jgi:TPR repeat protein
MSKLSMVGYLRKRAVSLAPVCFFLVLSLSAGFAAEVEGRRAALVIGNSAYEKLGTLPNAVNDASRMGEVLRHANFEVTVGENLDKKGTEKAVRDFLRTLNDGDVALFYYSGHAVQVAGENFILPVDASLASAYDLEVESFNINNLLDYMRETSSLQILVLDSCRDNPFKNAQFFLGEKKVTVASKDGLASLTPHQGSLIVYSTAPDQVAYDGGGQVSPFTDSFADNILTPNAEVRQILTEIRAEVIERTNGRQVPWDVSSLTSQFFFVSRQNVLIVGESLAEIRASPQQTRVRLGIAPPIASGGMKLTAVFDKLPAAGNLYLDDSRISAETEVDVARIQDVVYVSEPGEKPVELISYKMKADTGETVDGVVAIVFDPAIAPEQETVAQAPAAQEAASSTIRGASEKAEPVKVAMTLDVGTGFAPVSKALPQQQASRNGWMRIDKRSPSAQVALESEMLVVGDLISAEDVERIAIRPALRAGEGEVVLTPVSGLAEAVPLVIGVAASVNRCDELAADRLDIQGVAEGIFPNDLRADEAIAACREAIAEHPQVPRFRHQLGRALYANGEYDAAIVEFKAAWEAGHVRSGQLLGRFYQLGAGVEKDPSKAIPFFEAAAARGDPYAQHSLAKALIEGNGVEEDLQRGLDFYAKAVEAGHTYAMNGLGAAYLYGERVPKDVERAHSLFTASAARDDIWGVMNVGLLYRDGVVVEQDTARARALLTQAHEGMHPYAGRLIALMLRKEGSADQHEIFRLFRESADRGDAWSAFHAAEMMSADGSLMREPGENIRLYALALDREGGTPSERAGERLAGSDPAELNREIQKALIRLGAEGVEADGVLGTKTRNAARAILGGNVPQTPAELLADLIGREWIAGKPRLDML